MTQCYEDVMSLQSKHQDGGQPSNVAALLQMMGGYRVTQAIYVAVKLGIPDLLRDGPKRCSELAQSSGADPLALYRLLRALASLGILAETSEGTGGEEEGRFELTPLGEPLQSGAADSVRATTLMWGDELHWGPWGALLYSVKTGKPAFDHLFGMGIFEFVYQNSETADILGEAMTGGSGALAAQVLQAYDFSGIGKIVDIGGGHGSLITAVLKAHPHMQGVLFDLPIVIEGARARFEVSGVADRCELAEGSFFESIPEGGDAYIFSRVIHDWDDKRALAILKNCRRAMGDDAKILLVERAMLSGVKETTQSFGDLNLLVMNGSLERTESDFRDLFRQAGLRLSGVIPTESQLSIIEGIPA